MLTEKIQRKTYTVCCHLYVESKKYNKLVNVAKKETDLQIQNKLVVTNREREGKVGQFWGRGKIKTLVFMRLCEIIDENCEAQWNLKTLSFNFKKSWHCQATPSFLTFFLCFQYHHNCLFPYCFSGISFSISFIVYFYSCLSPKFNYFPCVLSLWIYPYPFF